MQEIKIGSLIDFGKYTWRVLDVKDNAALIITENIIEQRCYHNKYTYITWAECSLRQYLNGEFYDSFSENEKSRIIETVNKNVDNQWYGTTAGEDTRDKIFLLSIEEVACRYFGDSSENLYNRRPNQRYWLQRKDENNYRRVARLLPEKGGGIWWWWLRSPGRDNLKAVYIFGDGNIGLQGNNVLRGNRSDGRCTGGVRPAQWLRLD